MVQQDWLGRFYIGPDLEEKIDPLEMPLSYRVDRIPVRDEPMIGVDRIR